MRLLIAIIMILPLSLAANSGSFYGYSIHPDSWVSIQGTTNVNSFECLSETNMPRGYILAESGSAEDVIYFSEGLLELEISSFDCKNRKMNRDFQDALGVRENPTIGIKLLEAYYVKDKEDETQDKLLVKVAISLNGIVNYTEVTIDLDQANGYLFLFEGSKELAMSDFGIDPPSPALGLIKVRDNITINFNLVVEANLMSQN